MRSALYRLFFGQSVAQVEQERDSARAENLQLHARLAAMAEEREELRKHVVRLQEQVVVFSQCAIDGMVVNQGGLAWFGVGPKREPPPDVKWDVTMQRQREREKNAQMMKDLDLKPNKGMWAQNGAAATEQEG